MANGRKPYVAGAALEEDVPPRGDEAGDGRRRRRDPPFVLVELLDDSELHARWDDEDRRRKMQASRAPFGRTASRIRPDHAHHDVTNHALGIERLAPLVHAQAQPAGMAQIETPQYRAAADAAAIA